MDRRRFMPRAEGLDHRILLSGAHAPNNVPVANLHQKTVRIENLGKVLNSLQDGLVVPQSIVQPLQDDLRALVGRLGPANSNALVAAQLQYRSVISTASVSKEDLAGLNATFQKAIETTGAPQVVVNKLVQDMYSLAKFGTNQPNPSLLVANDYAVMLQTVLGVGRPIQRPAVPSLSPTDDSAPKGDHATTVMQPHLVGHYDTSSTIDLLDQNGTVIGTSTVDTTGAYSVAPSTPLSVGKHTLFVRATDANGDTSPPSRAYKLTIKAPRPPKHTTITTTKTTTTSGSSVRF